jgi:hypothetical protein
MRDAYAKAVNELEPDAKRARIQQLHLQATTQPGIASAAYPSETRPPACLPACLPACAVPDGGRGRRTGREQARKGGRTSAGREAGTRAVAVLDRPAGPA